MGKAPALALGLFCVNLALAIGRGAAAEPVDDVVASPPCRAVAAEMVRVVSGGSMTLVSDSGLRATTTALSLASAAAPRLLSSVGGGSAGGLVSEVLHAAASERQARGQCSAERQGRRPRTVVAA